MADYQKMYLTLFSAVTDAINALQQAQRQSEELYISSKEPVIKIMEKPDSESEKN